MKFSFNFFVLFKYLFTFLNSSIHQLDELFELFYELLIALPFFFPLEKSGTQHT